MSRFTLRNLFWLTLAVGAVLLFALNWRNVLFATFFAVALLMVLAVLVCLPTFIVSLCVNRSLSKAVEATKRVAWFCLQIVGELWSAAS